MITERMNNMHRLCEMARIGTTKDDYEIVIFTNDGGKIPHLLEDVNSILVFVLIPLNTFIVAENAIFSMLNNEKSLLIFFYQMQRKKTKDIQIGCYFLGNGIVIIQMLK